MKYTLYLVLICFLLACASDPNNFTGGEIIESKELDPSKTEVMYKARFCRDKNDCRFIEFMDSPDAFKVGDSVYFSKYKPCTQTIND
jgi:hypothetical protein